MVNKQRATLRLISSRTKIFIVMAVALLLSICGTAVVMAAIPDGNGIIHACRNTALGGLIRVIDNATQSCNSQYETALTWQQNGNGPGLVEDLTNADFNGADVRYRDFSNMDLSGADFSDAVFTGAAFTNANLTDVRMSGFGHNTNFSGTDLSETIPEDLTLTLSNFTNSTMSNEWDQVDFRGSNFDDADLSDAEFSSTNFGRHADMATNTSMDNTDFTNSDLIGANFDDTNLTTAILTNVTWTNTICPDGTNSNNNGNTCAGHLTP